MRSPLTLMMIKSLVTVLALATRAAGTEAQVPTHPQAQSSFVFPELSFKRLLDDLQVIVASTPYLGEGMTIGLVVRYGSTYDPADKGGVAHLLSKMFMKATQERSAKDIQDELNLLGATIDVRCDWDGIRFILRGQSSRFERSLLALYQIVGEAVFNDEDFAKVREELLAQMDKPEDPRRQVRTRFETALFQGTTYGRPPQGSRASLRNMTVGDVRYFYRRHFSPNGSSLVVVGSVPTSEVLQKATRIWGVWVRRDEVPFTFLPPRNPASRYVILQDDSASPAAQFILGNLWPRRDEPGFESGILALRILQERLTKALPTSLLTVGAEGRRLTGPFYIQGQAAADQVISEIRRIMDVVLNFKQSPVTPRELAEAQQLRLEEFKKRLGVTESICDFILDAELYRLGTNYMASFPDLVKRSIGEFVGEAAHQWIFPDGILIYVRGPASTLKQGLESLGSLQFIN